MFPKDWDQIWIIHESTCDILSLLNGWTLSTGVCHSRVSLPSLDPKRPQGWFQHRVDARECLLETQVKLAPRMRTVASI